MDLLQYVHMFLVLRSPELDTALDVCLHQCSAEREVTLPAFPNVAGDAVGHLCLEGALLAHGQLVVHQDSINPFLKKESPHSICFILCFNLTQLFSHRLFISSCSVTLLAGPSLVCLTISCHISSSCFKVCLCRYE